MRGQQEAVQVQVQELGWEVQAQEGQVQEEERASVQIQSQNH